MRKSEVRKWPEMDRQQKIQYLKDYYLLTAVGVILLIAVAVSLIWHVARPRTENLLPDRFHDPQRKPRHPLYNRLHTDKIPRIFSPGLLLLPHPGFQNSHNLHIPQTAPDPGSPHRSADCEDKPEVYPGLHL